jgi:hypothetical protein
MPYTGALGLLGLGTTAWFLGASGLILGIEVSAAFAPSPSLSRGRPAMARMLRPLDITRRRRRLGGGGEVGVSSIFGRDVANK